MPTVGNASGVHVMRTIERQKLMHALLELDCIPAGMELFPATDEEQWAHIKRVIDSSDYYVVVIAGRYGSIGPSGKSYTQMEYEYALDRGIPIVGFVRSDEDRLPDEKRDPGRAAELESFKGLVTKKLCKFWATPANWLVR